MISAWKRPAINGGTVTQTPTATPTATQSATTQQRTIIQPGSAWKPPVYGTVSVPVKQVMTDTGPVAIRTPPIVGRQDSDIDPGSLYTNQQIRDMLERGEMNERGERESGAEFDLEQQATDAGATSAFNRDANGTPVPPDAEQENKGLGWLLAAIAGYYFLT